MSIAHTRFVAAVLTLMSVTAVPSPSDAQEGDRYRELAQRIVQTSAAVKPGEVVFITGGKQAIPLMEALRVQVIRAGGIALSMFESEAGFSAFFRELPERHLRLHDSVSTAVMGDQLERADVMIWLPLVDNPDSLFQTFTSDTARWAKMMQTWSATQQRFDDMRNRARTRFVALGYPPIRNEIERSGMDSASFDRMIWEAMTTDYDRIAAAGQSIKRLVDAGKIVRVTTPEGTDLRLTLGGRRAAVMAGSLTAEQKRSKLAAHRTVALPGGRVAVAPLESSVTGKVVVPRNNCLGVSLVNARFEFRAGKLTGFEADSGASCVTNYLSTSKSPGDRFGSLSIGLNPALKPMLTGVGYYPSDASGAVVLSIGNNTDLGGRNVTPGAIPFWLSRATVEIDGKVVVKDGQVVSNVAQKP